MVQIKIRKIKEIFHVICEFYDFEQFLIELKKRLDFFTLHQTCDFEAFFHIPSINEEQYVSFFQLCNQNKVYILGINWTKKEEVIQFYEPILRSGEEYYFHHSVILCCDLGSDVRIVSNASIYVMGTVKGTIDLLHRTCELYATGFEQANIRICESDYQNVTSFARGKVYYEDGKVVYQIQKEEEVWQKQLQLRPEKAG